MDNLTAPGERQEWGTARRLGFLVVFCFVLLFVLPFPFDEFGLTSWLAGWWRQLWAALVPWVADHVLHLGFDVRHSTGGGEPTREYLRAGCAAVIALVVATVWTLVDRRRTDLPKLDQWLRVYLRLYLAATLFSYGFDKVFALQFSAPGPDRLSQTFGEASPSGFLWAFMGYSVPYQVFAGIGELTAGVLLCFRRTTTLGALVGVAVMGNVVALNFSYDVGVKLNSSFYLLALAFLAAPDFKRLVDFLLLNRATNPVPLPHFAGTSWKNRLALALPGLLGGYFLVTSFSEEYASLATDGRSAPRPPLYGLYDVESVLQNGVTSSMRPVDSTHWARLAIGENRSTIRLASGTLGFYVASVDTMARTLRFKSRDDSTVTFVLRYERPDTVHLVLRGRLGGDSIEMRLGRRDEKKYRLVSHRFHWAQDRAENR